MEELENLDGVETALLLIDSGAGTVTPYGVVYDNGMRLEQLYNGRQFPEYLYDNSNLGLKIMPAEGQKPELLWLPASEQQIRRTLLRAGVRDAGTAQYTIPRNTSVSPMGTCVILSRDAGRRQRERL